MTERPWPPKTRQLDLGDDDFPLPPADLRERVIGVSFPDLEFRASGRQSVSDFESVLASGGKSFAGFDLTDALPPLPYADNTFDLVIGNSVFTHLPE